MPVSASTNSEVTVTVDGNPVNFHNQGPVIINGHMLVPAHEVFAQMGFRVRWDARANRVHIFGDGIFMWFDADAQFIWFYDYFITPDVPWQFVSGQFMVPLRAIAEALGATVHWDAVGRVANVVSPEPLRNIPSSPFRVAFDNFAGWSIEVYKVYDGAVITVADGAYVATEIEALINNAHRTLSARDDANYYIEQRNVLSATNGIYVGRGSLIDGAFTVWAEYNNVHNAVLIEGVYSGITARSPRMPSSAWGISNLVELTLSPEFLEYFEGDNGLLLAESLANSFISITKWPSAYSQVDLIVSGEVIFSTSDFIRWQSYGNVAR